MGLTARLIPCGPRVFIPVLRAHRAFSRYFQASRKRLQALKPRSHDFHFNSSQPLFIVIIYDREKGYENG
jgi:hypothetical protein